MATPHCGLHLRRDGAGEAAATRETLFGRRFWTLLVIALGLLACSGVTARTGLLSQPTALLNTAIAPVEWMVTACTRTVGGFFANIGSLWSLHAQNAQLKSEVQQLQAEVAQDAELRAENAHLSALVGLQTADNEAGYGVGVAARVIGRSADAWYNSVVIDRGSRSGIRSGMVAVTSDGLVGRVDTGVGPTTSRVMLLTNPDFGVGVLVQRSRDAGVALGRLGSYTLTVTFFSPTPDVRPGDLLVTSGLASANINGDFPKGLPVGVVRSVQGGGFGLTREAVVEPVARVDALEELLLLPASGQGPG